jgi:DNA polymerase-3 subunit beta
VDAKKLHAILTHARSYVNMEVYDAVIQVRFGSSKYDLPTMAATPLPTKPFKSPTTVPAKSLVPIVTQALTVASEGSYGALLVTSVRGIGLRAVATDGLRLLVADTPMEPPAIDALLISQRAAEAICQLPGGTFHIFTDETSLVVDTGAARLVARKTSAKFPEYEKVIPVNIKREYVVKAEDMVAALDRMGAVADEKHDNVRLTLTNDSAKLQVPGAEDTVPLTGRSLEPNFDVDFDVLEDALSFRYSFLVNFFSLCKGNVSIKIEGPKTPVLFENGPLKFIMASAYAPVETQ